ncbi:MAG: MFS transporter, partial [Faecalibacterium sp.]|nr:MFS transporter [Faecalibacterium sp.]
RTCGLIMIGVGVLLAIFMPVPKDVEYTNKSLLDSFKAVLGAFKLPVTYLLAGLIFAGSLTGAAASHYAPYMTKVLGLPQTVAIIFTSYRGVICGLIGASTAALMATKFGRSSKPLLMFAGIWLACYVVMWALPGTSAVMWPVLIITVLASLCHSTFRALYYATIDEMGTPKTQVGSVIGLASILGFLPDTFYSTMVGGWLDANGDAAYKMIWMTCIAAVALGLVCAVITDRKILAFRKANGEG